MTWKFSSTVELHRCEQNNGLNMGFDTLTAQQAGYDTFTATVHANLKRKYMAQFAISQKRTSGVKALIYTARGTRRFLCRS